ncbi:lachrymatory-factor synthase [Phtheirospermum japonicum]|uniref:Lachrymatory-factor synthase n=1 Tax=Phtheirospermum japonicum TaxID=374723 RepID=A0A830BCD2_9LAMI|nr:lachrymatory-factor synthase [Phtheirospermum japonicum]
MDQNLSQQKWEAKVSTSLERARPQQIWPLFEDFFGLQKWFPGLATCHGIEGANGEPGCIRFCSGFGLKKQKENNNDSNSDLSWSKERLVAVDRAQMTLTYEMVDCNIGFKSYVSTVKVVPGYEGGRGGGTSVEWCISLDPVVGLRLEDLVGKYEVGLKLMVKKMEAAITGESSYMEK